MTEPFLRWPGGKRWIAEEIAGLVAEALSGTYYEPFLGSGAVFFALAPERAALGDVDDELISTYRAIRWAPIKVRDALRRLSVSKKDYYRIRKSRPQRTHTKAARLLYLNRTAFSGIYRKNRAGEFNVPFGGGRTTKMLCAPERLKAARDVMRGVEFYSGDFEHLMNRAGTGDVVYCDPTYTVTHENNGFVRYNERVFSWNDQKRLAAAAERAVGRGATVLISNAFHKSIRMLYVGFPRWVLTRHSRISANPEARREIREYLFVMNP